MAGKLDEAAEAVTALRHSCNRSTTACIEPTCRLESVSLFVYLWIRVDMVNCMQIRGTVGKRGSPCALGLGVLLSGCIQQAMSLRPARTSPRDRSSGQRALREGDDPEPSAPHRRLSPQGRSGTIVVDRMRYLYTCSIRARRSATQLTVGEELVFSGVKVGAARIAVLDPDR